MVGFVRRKKTVMYTRSAKKLEEKEVKLIRQVIKRWGIREVAGGEGERWRERKREGS